MSRALPRPADARGQARALVLREPARGPRTLGELARWALAHTDYRTVAAAAPLPDELTGDGLATAAVEPGVGRTRFPRLTYRLAPRKVEKS